MINISGLPLILYSSRLLLPLVLKLAISLTLDFTLPPGLLPFCSILPKVCLALFWSYTLPLSLSITHRFVLQLHPPEGERWIEFSTHYHQRLCAQLSLRWWFPCLCTNPTALSQTLFLQEVDPESLTLLWVKVLSSNKIHSRLNTKLNRHLGE